MIAENNIIELRSISKCYTKDEAVIENFNLSIKKGEFVTLLGPSGCGKTTILRMIGGFELPTSGKILLHGEDISHLPANKRPINTVFQKYALFPYLNIYDNIAFGLKLKKLPKEIIDEKVKHVLEVVDLEGFEKRSISTLSGGQQQRIAIARAIVNEPEILLLDEPLGALDYKMRKEMQYELKEMHNELGITFIFVTHDQEEALTMSDKIVIMSDGRIQQSGRPEEIYSKPKNAFVADFIGESNIFNGVMTGPKKITFCDTEFECIDEYPVGTRVDAVIRPEHIELTTPEKGSIAGEVSSSIFKGTSHEIIVMDGKNEFTVSGRKAIDNGTMVGMNIAPEHIHVMPDNESVNHYIGVLDEEYCLQLGDGVRKPDLTKIYAGTVWKNQELYGSDGKIFVVENRQLEASFESHDAELSDDPDAGFVRGNIISIIYKGDHYNYVVRSENEFDYFVDDEYLWNLGDYVSVIIPEEKVTYKVVD